jgi:hypothetical protein
LPEPKEKGGMCGVLKMTLYDYQQKLKESQNKELHKQLDRIYRSIFPDKTVIRLDYEENRDFQRTGRDIRITLRKPGNNPFNMCIFETIEEKIRTPEHSYHQDILIEYLSNKQLGTLGWIYTSEADWLSYVKQPKGFLEVFIFPMQDLKHWFILQKDRYKDIISGTLLSSSSYNTVNKAILLEDPIFNDFLSAHGYFYRKERWSKT